jgi:hypothetical protein
MWHELERREVHARFLYTDVKEGRKEGRTTRLEWVDNIRMNCK